MAQINPFFIKLIEIGDKFWNEHQVFVSKPLLPFFLNPGQQEHELHVKSIFVLQVFGLFWVAESSVPHHAEHIWLKLALMLFDKVWENDGQADSCMFYLFKIVLKRGLVFFVFIAVEIPRYYFLHERWVSQRWEDILERPYFLSRVKEDNVSSEDLYFFEIAVFFSFIAVAENVFVNFSLKLWVFKNLKLFSGYSDKFEQDCVQEKLHSFAGCDFILPVSLQEGSEKAVDFHLVLIQKCVFVVDVGC